MKRKILIPLDGSAFSRRILKHVLRYFSPQHHSLVLLRVSDRPRGMTAHPKRVVDAYAAERISPQYENERDVTLSEHPIYDSQQFDSVFAQCKDELLREQMRLRRAGFEVETAVRFGDAAREIVEFAREENVDAIAMATHSRSGLSAVLAGSVAEYVLRHVSVPVMLLRRAERERAGMRMALNMAGARRVRHASLS